MSSLDAARNQAPPIAHLFDDPDLDEISINNNRRVFVCRAGLRTSTNIELTEQQIQDLAVTIARGVGKEINESSPSVSARLKDGSRVQINCPPATPGGYVISIRKFNPSNLTTEQLVSTGYMTEKIAHGLVEAVEERQNIAIVGGTGAGKTTLLNALARHIPAYERIVVIEDTTEIKLAHEDIARLEAGEGVSIRSLLKDALRHAPSRIIVGEVRDGAAWDLLQAMNTGHSGGLTTWHADSAALALNRFTNMCLQADLNMSYSQVRAEIADAIGLVVLCRHDQRTGRRYVKEIIQIEGYDFEAQAFELRHLYPEKELRAPPPRAQDHWPSGFTVSPNFPKAVGNGR